MIYIVIALKPEVQAFVDFYKLKKEKLLHYTIFKNSSIIIILSGVGVDNARFATQTLINQFDITDDDIYMNVGICGANEDYAIGSLLEIGEISYKELLYSFKEDKKKIVSLDAEATTNLHDIVDMESYGFYDAVIHNPAIKKFYIFKVVSDHFEPHLVTKEKTKSLIFNAINTINTIIQH